MLKKIFTSFFALFFCVTLFSGCQQDITEYINTHMAENCNNYFVGQTENFYLELFNGQREELYELNGVSEPLVDYCMIIATPKESISIDALEYCVEVNSQTYTGNFERSPFDNSWASDFEIKINKEDTIFVYIQRADCTEVARMNCVSKDFLIDYSKALVIAKDVYIDILNENIDKKIDFEVFVQILNKTPQLELYFWSVNFVFNNGLCYTVLIDTQNGDVLAKNV